MKNKKKIITIIILSILLVLIVGISYAYFTAKVEGNEEAKNINVEAGKMKVKLTGPERITAEYLIPGESRSITFTVENTGTVPAIYNLDMIEVVNDFDPSSDLVYTVTSDNNGGHVQDKEAPTKNQTLIRNILIQPETIQTYTLTILFKETDINQNSNQNKTFEGRIQINNLEDTTMATRIIRTTKLQTEEPDFSHKSPEVVDGVTIDYGTGMFAAEDDEGTSYYFRGRILNNYVEFAKKTWRIMRINGDGSIRLILNGSAGVSTYNNSGVEPVSGIGYTYDNKHNCTQDNPCISDYNQEENIFEGNYNGTDSTIKTFLEDWYIKELSAYDKNIALSTFCNDTTIISLSNWQNFGPTDRVGNNPILTCPNPTNYNSETIHNFGGVYKLKIGLVTADELNMYGYSNSSYGRGFNDSFFPTWSWILSPTHAAGNNQRQIIVIGGGGFNFALIGQTNSVTPIINLKPDVSFTTNGEGEPGTESNPYVVK